MATAILSSKGQLTVPKKIRMELGLGPGDRVTFVKMDDGNYAVMPSTESVMTLKGFLKKPSKPITLDEMDESIAAGAQGK